MMVRAITITTRIKTGMGIKMLIAIGATVLGA
jgi:hypothetical protein